MRTVFLFAFFIFQLIGLAGGFGLFSLQTTVIYSIAVPLGLCLIAKTIIVSWNWEKNRLVKQQRKLAAEQKQQLGPWEAVHLLDLLLQGEDHHGLIATQVIYTICGLDIHPKHPVPKVIRGGPLFFLALYITCNFPEYPSKLMGEADNPQYPLIYKIFGNYRLARNLGCVYIDYRSDGWHHGDERTESDPIRYILEFDPVTLIPTTFWVNTEGKNEMGETKKFWKPAWDYTIKEQND